MMSKERRPNRIYRIALATYFRYRDKKCRKNDNPFTRVLACVV